MSNNTPTTETDWALDSAAQKTIASSGHRDLGWTTSTGTIEGTPEKPTSHLLNGWQNNLGQWVDLFKTSVDSDLQDASDYLDVFEFDTANVVGNQDPFVETITRLSNWLTWSRPEPVVGGAAPWEDYKADNCFGGLIYECIDILNQGLAIELVDGGGTWTWRIWKTTLASFSDFSFSGNAEFGQDQSFGIPDTGVDPTFIIERTDGVSVITETDFSAFVQLNIGNFGTSNPFGVRAVMKGGIKYQSGFTAKDGKGYFKNIVPVKRWFRPIVNNGTDLSSNSYSFTFRGMVPNKRYRLTLNLEATTNSGGVLTNLVNITLGNAPALQNLIQVPDGLNKANGQSWVFDQEFMFLNDFSLNTDEYGITINGVNLVFLNTSSGDIGTLYSEVTEKFIILEELS